MCLNVIKQIDFIDFSYGLACPNPAVLGSLAQTQNSLTCYSNKKFYRGNVMSGPFISLRAIKIINLIITTVWSYDMSHVGDVMTSFIITSLWVIITYLLDFFFINSISLFFYFFEFLFWMWRSKEKWVFSHSNLFSKRPRILFFFLCAFCLDQSKSSISLWAPPWMNEKNQRKRNWRFPEGRSYDSLKWLILVTHKTVTHHRSDSSWLPNLTVMGSKLNFLLLHIPHRK